MQVTHDPKAIANFFIEAAAAEGKKLTPLQIIKLVYIAHGWYLALRDEPLINEPPEAWQYGPVIPSLYHTLKIYGNEPVPEPITKFTAFTEKFSRSQAANLNISLATSPIPPPTDERLRKFLSSIWKAYGKFSGSQLSTLTHQSDTPWHQTWEKEGAKYSKGVDIPEDLIRKHYKDLYALRTAGRQ